MESLLEQNFQPERTVVLAFGIDEESSGKEGADKIYLHLDAVYGKDSFAALLDEGSEYSSFTGVRFESVLLTMMDPRRLQ